MFFGFSQLDLLVQSHLHAVYLGTHVAFASQIFDQIRPCALFLAHERSVDDDFSALGQLLDLVYDVASRHFRDRFAALVAVLDADTSIKKAQIVVNFRYRAHG